MDVRFLDPDGRNHPGTQGTLRISTQPRSQVILSDSLHRNGFIYPTFDTH